MIFLSAGLKYYDTTVSIGSSNEEIFHSWNYSGLHLIEGVDKEMAIEALRQIRDRNFTAFTAISAASLTVGLLLGLEF